MRSSLYPVWLVNHVVYVLKLNEACFLVQYKLCSRFDLLLSDGLLGVLCCDRRTR